MVVEDFRKFGPPSGEQQIKWFAISFSQNNWLWNLWSVLQVSNLDCNLFALCPTLVCKCYACFTDGNCAAKELSMRQKIRWGPGQTSYFRRDGLNCKFRSTQKFDCRVNVELIPSKWILNCNKMLRSRLKHKHVKLQLCIWFDLWKDRHLTPRRSSDRSSDDLLQQTERSSWTIQIQSDELNWVKRRSYHELINSLNLVRLVWSTTFDPGLSLRNCIVLTVALMSGTTL